MSFLLSFLSGPLLSFLGGPVIKGMIDAYNAKLAAGNTSERIAADLAGRELLVEQRERELATQLLVVEQGNWVTRWVRPLWAMPFIIWTWKVIVWDKVLGNWTHGNTDSLEGWVATLGVTIAAAYFGGRTIENVARIIKR